MSKAYADLVSNFLSILTNLVLLRHDAYLRHAHPNLDAFRVRNLHAAPVSGGDLFERSLMQEYEPHLIGLGVKPGSKKEQRFHPYKKNKRGRGGRQQAPPTHARQLLEASHRLKFTKQIPGHSKVQDRDPRVHTCLPQEGGMGHIYRSHRCLSTRTYSHPVSEIPQVSFQRRHLPVHQPPIRASNSPPHFHQYSQRGKTDSFAIRNQTPPIPGRLVDPCPLRTTMHGSNTKTTKAGEGFGLL